MKKLLLFLSFAMSFVGVYAQQVVQRSSAANTVLDEHLFAKRNFRPPVFADTTAANATFNPKLDSAGRLIYTYAEKGYWLRQHDPKMWVRVGSVSRVTGSNSVLVDGDGSDATPYVVSIIRSAQANNAVQIFPDGVFVQSQVPDGRVDGGIVIHRTGLTYTVTAATYVINGVTYTSPETEITLPNADPDDPRFDAFVVTTAGTAISLTGTPDPDNPQNPSYDPATQLPLTFVQVLPASTEPVFCRDSIYYPNNGNTWLAVPSTVTRIDVAATANPYTPTQHISFTAAQNNDRLRMEKGSTISFSTYTVMVIRLRSKAAWASTSRIEFQVFNLTTPLGTPVIIGDGTPYGFNSSNTVGYQTLVVPIPNLGSNISTGNTIALTVRNTGANTIGFDLDDWELLGCDGTPPPTSGSFWTTTGNQEGRTLFGGTLDNQVVQLLANNLNHTQLKTDGTTWMQGVNPGISLFLGSFAAADYFIQRIANTLTLNVASAAIIDHTIQGFSRYNISTANGHLFRNSSGAFQMQINPTGQVMIGTNSVTASNLLALNSTTQALRLTVQTTGQMNAIANDEGMLTYNTTTNTLYYNDGAAWLPLGSGTVTADNGLTMSTATNAQWGGALTTNATTTITGDNGNEKIVFTGAPTSGTWFLVQTSTVTNAIEGVNLAGGNAVQGSASSGNGVVGLATSGTGVNGYSEGGAPALFQQNTSATNTTTTILDLYKRLNSGTVGASFAAAIDFTLETDANFQRLNNRIIAGWDDRVDATRSSFLTLSGINQGVSNSIATFEGDGAVGIGITNPITSASRLQVRDNNLSQLSMTFLQSTSALVDDNGTRLLNIDFSGANASSSITTQGIRIVNTRTGTNSRNEGIDITVSGGSSNYGLEIDADDTPGGVGALIRSQGTGVSVSVENPGGGSRGIEVQGNFGNMAMVLQTYDGDVFQIERLNETAGTLSDLETIGTLMRISSTNNPVAGVGLGSSLDWHLFDNTGDGRLSGKIIHELTAVGTGSALKSQWRFQVKDNDVGVTTLTTAFTIASTGTLTLGEAYQGLGAGCLQVDNAGVVTWGACGGGGGTYTASNGLTMVGNDNRIGGTLTQNSTIATTSSFSLTISGSEPTGTNGILNVTQTAATGNGIYATANSTNGAAIYGTSSSSIGVNGTGNVGVLGSTTSGTALWGIATSGTGLLSQTTSGTNSLRAVSNPSSTNTVVAVASFERTSSGTAADGIGVSIDLKNEVDNLTTQISNQIISKFTTADDLTRVSQFIITGVDNAVTGDKFIINGDGSAQLPDYGINTFAGTPAYNLGVDASGNIIEVSAAGAGMTNPLTTTGDMIYSSSGTTPARLGIGAEGEILTVVSGIPAWAAVGVGGSVTTVSWTGGIVSIANPTTAPAFTIAGTSGGGVYFSSSSAWASTALLAANAIMIGGGAGSAYSTTTTASGIVTWIGTPSSANLASAVTDETGSGALVFANSPTLVSPALGTPSSATLSNATGLPIIAGTTGTLTVARGGTGITSGTSGGIPYFSSTSTIASSALLAANAIMIGGGAGAAPTTTTTATGVLVFIGTPNSANLRTVMTDETGTGLLYFQSGNLGTPTGGTISTGVTIGDVTMNVAGVDATGDMYYRNASGILVRLPIGASGTFLSSNSGIPVWGTPAGGGTVLSVSGGTTGFTFTNPTSTPTMTGTLGFANGGTSATSRQAAINALAGSVTAGNVLRTDGVNVVVGKVNMNTDITGVTPVANGGTNISAITSSRVLITNASGYVQALPTGSNGIVINMGAGTMNISYEWNPAEQTLTSGATINWNVANGANANLLLNNNNATLAMPTNLINGYTYTLYITQGAGGSHTISTWTNVEWQNGGAAPTLSTVAGQVDVITLKYRASTGLLYGTYGVNFQ